MSYHLGLHDSIMSNHPLTEYRKRRRITQQELANELAVTSVTISRWETGERTPGRVNAKRISDHTGIPILELLRLAEAAQ